MVRTIARPDAQALHRHEQTSARQQTHPEHFATTQTGGDDLAPVFGSLLLLLLRSSIDLRNVRHGDSPCGLHSVQSLCSLCLRRFLYWAKATTETQRTQRFTEKCRR